MWHFWSGLALHFGSKRLKPAKNKYIQSDFTSFFKQVLAYLHNFCFQSLCALHFQSLSNRCRHKHDPSISRIFQSNFGRVFDVWPNCALLAWPGLLFLRANYLSQLDCKCHHSFFLSIYGCKDKRGLLLPISYWFSFCFVHTN